MNKVPIPANPHRKELAGVLTWVCKQSIKLKVVLMHRQSSIPFNQSGIGVRAITMTAKTAPANAAAPITAAVFLLRFFFTALQISMAQTTQTAAAASAMASVSHNHESSYNILIRSPYLSLANCGSVTFLVKVVFFKRPLA